MTLQDFFAENPRAALAFSGGTDSAYLLYAAVKCGAEIQAYYVNSAFQAGFELSDAVAVTSELHVPLRIVDTDILSVPEAASNGARRCYYCKRALFTALQRAAAADGYTLLLDGTNASDEDAQRPGMQALRELSVRSPLRECGLTKAEIRRLSREAGLFTWDKPAYACLATRVPTGTEITAALLRKIERAEEALTALGYRDFRVRLLGDAARLQLRREQFGKAAAEYDVLLHTLQNDFTDVLLDLQPRGQENYDGK